MKELFIRQTIFLIKLQKINKQKNFAYFHYNFI